MRNFSMPINFYLASPDELDQLRRAGHGVFRPGRAGRRIDHVLRTLPKPPLSYTGPSHYLASVLAHLDESGLVAVDPELSEQLGLVLPDSLEFLRPLDSDLTPEDVEAHIGELLHVFHGGDVIVDPSARDGLANALRVLITNLQAATDGLTLVVRF